MSQRSSSPAEPGGASGPADCEPEDWDDDDEWPDDLWPGDDEPAEGLPGRAGAGGNPPGEGLAWPAPSWPGLPPPPPPPRRLPVAALVAIALCAAGIGALIVFAARGLSGSPAAPASQPSVQAPAQPGAGGGAFPGGGPEMFVGGRVTAVSGTSITIGGPGRSITAAVTSSTQFTGKVSSISGVKVGDQVSAQLTQNGGTATAVSISDPAQLPAGAGGP